MTRAALKAVGEMDEGFGKLAAEGIIDGTAVPMEETALQAAAMYSKQAKDRLNKVNTVMRYFAKNTAMAAVYKAAELVNKQQHLDTLNKAAGKVIMGAESRQTAVRQCIKEMSERGIPAFVDAGGRQWSPEAYINMDVRTTCSNVAHEAQFTRMDDYSIDLLETSSHPGARPKCSLDQGKIFSRSGKNKKYPAWKTSSYGEPDGILGINCGHFIYPYIEGVSVQRYFPYDKEENDKLYKQKQEQRRLEREVRSAKREVSMLNAAGDKEGAKLAKETVKQKTAKYNEYCEKVGLPRKADRLTVQGYRTKAKEEKKMLPTLDNGGGSGIIEIERAMAAKTFDAAADYAKKELKTSISSLSELPLSTVNAVNDSIRRLYKNIPSLSGFIDEVIVDDIDEIASSAIRWVNDSPQIRLKLSRSYFANMSIDELEDTISNLVSDGVFTPKKGIDGIIQHEAVHLAEFKQTLKKYAYSQEMVTHSLDEYELANEIKSLALANCSLDDNEYVTIKYLGSYAGKDPAEFIAEGYSSTETNELTTEIKRLLKKKWGM